MTRSLLCLLAVASLNTGCRAGSSDNAADSSASAVALPDNTRTDSSSAPTAVVTEKGFGGVIAGMTVTEASAATGMGLSLRGGSTEGCTYVDWPGGPSGVELMAENGRIVRVDVSDSTIATAEGAKVGDSEQRVMELYAGRIVSTPHKYTSGKYLTVTPGSPSDSAYRIVFETENGRVTTYRSGIRPPVEYVERCG